MFKKKNPAKETASVKKAGPLKRVERRFFNFFNDKKSGRRFVLTTLMMSAPAMLWTDMQKEDPSNVRRAGGAEQVEQYRSEMRNIARDGNTIRITGEGSIAASDAQRALEIEARTMALAARLANDIKISERDAQALTRQFMQDMNNPAISRELRNILGTLAHSSAFLEEARAQTRTQTGDIGARANKIIETASSLKASDDSIYKYMLNYFIMCFLFESTAMAWLRRGSRRDDKLKKEELIENFSEHAAKLREMLAPKGTPPASTPVPPKPPAPPKRGR